MKPTRHPKTPKPLTVQERFSFDKDDWLAQCRETATRLLRQQDTVTVEDILLLCPKPEYLHRNTIGSIFNSNFIPVDFVKAKHKAAKGRWIRTWRKKVQRVNI